MMVQNRYNVYNVRLRVLSAILSPSQSRIPQLSWERSVPLIVPAILNLSVVLRAFGFNSLFKLVNSADAQDITEQNTIISNESKGQLIHPDARPHYKDSMRRWYKGTDRSCRPNTRHCCVRRVE